MLGRILAFIFLLGILCATGRAEPQPVLALLEYHFGTRSPGPSLVIYDDGLVVYRSIRQIPRDGPNEYSWLKDFSYLAVTVPDPNAFIRKMFPYAWSALKPRYVLSAATDQSQTYVWHRGQIVEIYGDWREFLGMENYRDMPHGAEIVESENKLRRSLPQTLRRFLLDLDQYTPADAKPWLPEYIVLNFWKCSHPVDGALSWPMDFPKHVVPYRTSSTGVTEITMRLPGSKYPGLAESIGRMSYPGGVNFDGTQYFVTNLSFPFPGESIWRRDFENKAKEDLEKTRDYVEKLPRDEREKAKRMLGL